MNFPDKPVLQSEMKRNEWITYKWVNIHFFSEAEPRWLCTGLREISEAVEAAKQFDEYWKASRGLWKM